MRSKKKWVTIKYAHLSGSNAGILGTECNGDGFAGNLLPATAPDVIPRVYSLGVVSCFLTIARAVLGDLHATGPAILVTAHALIQASQAFQCQLAKEMGYGSLIGGPFLFLQIPLSPVL